MKNGEFSVGDRVSSLESHRDLPLYNANGCYIRNITLSPQKALRISKTYLWDSVQVLNLEAEPGLFLNNLPASLFDLTMNNKIAIRKDLIKEMFNNLL